MATEDMTGRTPPAPSAPDEGAPPPGTRIGRFIVIDTLGMGGMGLVLSAYDPALDRKVAIKLLRPGLGGVESVGKRTTRLLREAQAMAKIAHRNVVAVHEVGTFEDQVFLAMEYVDGQPLSAWLSTPRPPREVIGKFIAAARGLEAAHALALVHRDFKPDNVLVTSEGRVLVTDFGVVAIAGETGAGSTAGDTPAGLTRDGAVVGTPAYMAPEQRAGGTIDARADQYAFCVALERALGERRPRWIRPLIQRGLAEQPSQRHPSMRTLADALERGPGRALRVAAPVALLALTTAVVVYAARRDSAGAPPCEGFEARFAGVWDQAARQRLDAAFARTGRAVAADSAARVGSALDAYGRGWVAMRRDACLATALRREQSPALLDLRMACLDRRLDAERALVKVLTAADGDIVARAPQAVLALEPFASCADTVALTAALPPPRDPAQRAWVKALEQREDTVDGLRLAGRIKAMAPLAAQLAIEAEANGYPPAVARALTIWARAARDIGRPDLPEIVARGALAAAAARDDAGVARDLGFLVSFYAERGEHAQAEALRPALLAAAERSGDDLARSRARYTLGMALNAAGKPGDADAAFAAAMTLQERVLGPDDLELAQTLDQRASVLNHLARLHEARALLERSVAIVERRLGSESPLLMGSLGGLGLNAHLRDDHETSFRLYEHMLRIGVTSYGADSPRMWVPMGNAASELGHLDRTEEALALNRRALPLAEKAFGPEAPPVASLRIAIAGQLDTLKRPGEAQHEIALSLAIFEKREPDSLNTALALGVAARIQNHDHHVAEALILYQRALAIHEKKRPAGPDGFLETMIGLGGCLRELGRVAEARAVLERAREIEEAGPSFAGVRAALDWELAQAVADRARAVALAEDARAFYATRTDPSIATAIDSWLARGRRR